jgi:hypothetical protein
MRARRSLVLAGLLLLASGCASRVVPRPYTEQELQDRCHRRGGWWHADELVGGYCEFQSPGMIRLPVERPAAVV